MALPPPFLHLDFTQAESQYFTSYSGVFKHKGGDARTRWWPSASSQVRTIILFIPGNPGLVDFYTPFLSALHADFRNDGLAILAHGHLGHTADINVPPGIGLLHQVESALEIFDSIKACWSDAKVVLVGHSVGTWIALQILKVRQDRVDAVFMLCPSISNLAQTPNGKQLSWLFLPLMAFIISRLSILIQPISAFLLSLLFPWWPASQRALLHSLIRSPPVVFACLTMGRDEMRIITAPDVALLHRHSSKLWFYYVETDGWVGKEREKIISLLGESASARVVHCRHNIPHDFEILHGDLVAAQCADWLRQNGLCGVGN